MPKIHPRKIENLAWPNKYIGLHLEPSTIPKIRDDLLIRHLVVSVLPAAVYTLLYTTGVGTAAMSMSACSLCLQALSSPDCDFSKKYFRRRTSLQYVYPSVFLSTLCLRRYRTILCPFRYFRYIEPPYADSTFKVDLEYLTSFRNLDITLFTGSSVAAASLVVSGLLPSTEHYLTYEGSLTEPACHETVTWIIPNKPLYINVAMRYCRD
nr:uncharacterized protein LOC113802695 [Penaeus vannamei]